MLRRASRLDIPQHRQIALVQEIRLDSLGADRREGENGGDDPIDFTAFHNFTPGLPDSPQDSGPAGGHKASRRAAVSIRPPE